MTTYRHAAFTLIELLVVVAIITVLAAIILPIYFSVQNTASSAASVSNFRQIGAAIQSYANDNIVGDASLPGVTTPLARRTWPLKRSENGRKRPAGV